MTQYNEWDSQGLGETFTNAELGEYVNIQPLVYAKQEAERVQKLKVSIMAQMLTTIENLDLSVSNEVFISVVRGFADEIKALTK